MDHRCLGRPVTSNHSMPARLSSYSSGVFEFEDELLPSGLLGGDLLYQGPVVLRLQVLESEILQLGLDAGHTKPVGERGVDLARLGGDPYPLLRRQRIERPHVVEPVGQLDDDDPRILGDRQQQLAVVLDLLLRRGAEGEAGDLGEAVHQPRHFGTEFPGDVLGTDVRVFDHVVQQGRADRGGVEELFHQSLGDGDRMLNEVLARHPLLTPMRRRTEAQRPIDLLQIEPVGVPLQQGTEVGGNVGQGTGHRSPAPQSYENDQKLPRTVTSPGAQVLVFNPHRFWEVPRKGDAGSDRPRRDRLHQPRGPERCVLPAPKGQLEEYRRTTK